MRDMKCRVWDGETLRYLPTMIVDEFSIGFTMEDEFYVDINNHHPTPGLIVTWWTGLKDRHGKEIYEGDILSDNWIVVWHEAGFYLHIPKLFTNTLYMPMSEKQESKIIGNIYENPELLNEKS